MKISYNWLKDYLECDLAPEAVAEALTSIGLEVDSLEQIEEIPGGLAGVIVAEVVECVDHPDSDHLHITKLNTGDSELLQVVCGAPNVAAGQKVLLATVGTVLGEDFKIKKSKIIPVLLRGDISYILQMVVPQLCNKEFAGDSVCRIAKKNLGNLDKPT